MAAGAAARRARADWHCDRRAFDGVIAHIAGSARGGDFNARFARPNGLGLFVASLFPYLDVDQRDPVTGKTDGVLMKLNKFRHFHMPPDSQPFAAKRPIVVWRGHFNNPIRMRFMEAVGSLPIVDACSPKPDAP